MENLENKKHVFSPEIYERAKAAKERALDFVSELKTDPALTDLNDFSALEKAVGQQDTDVRIVIGLGRLNWNKGTWGFDAPSTASVMARMQNLDDPSHRSHKIRDYTEIHIKYDALSMENQDGFRRHTINHNIYTGRYGFDEGDTDAASADWEKDDAFSDE